MKNMTFIHIKTKDGPVDINAAQIVSITVRENALIVHAGFNAYVEQFKTRDAALNKWGDIETELTCMQEMNSTDDERRLLDYAADRADMLTALCDIAKNGKALRHPELMGIARGAIDKVNARDDRPEKYKAKV